jgi:caffeoyl-CoA O-methyltransferase
MEIIPQPIEEYIDLMSTEESDILRHVTRETYLHQIYPKMISGKVQGKFLEMLSRMIGPERILEIGTFTAYSTVCLAQGLTTNGKLITIEKNPELEETIVKHLELAGLKQRVQVIIGDALEVIPRLSCCFDLVFIDADKEFYTEYFTVALPLVKTGGFILADNVLWSGKVIEEEAKADKETKGIIRFNNYIADCAEVENVILPIRDGISVIRKK